jgi:hypothetical protein
VSQQQSAGAKSAPEMKEGDDREDHEDQIIGGGFTSREEVTDALPEFLKAENIKDIHANRPHEADYDDTSLLIPKHEWASFTPCMT